MWVNVSKRHRRFVEETRQPLALADCPEGQLTDVRSPLRMELRDMIANVCRNMPSEFDYN